MKTAFSLILLVITVFYANAQEYSNNILKKPYQPIAFKPFSELEQDEQLKKIIDELLIATENKDWVTLKKHLSKKEGFAEKFYNQWKPSNKESELWSKLNKALRLGGYFYGEKKDYYYSPYIGKVMSDKENLLLEKYDLKPGDQTNFTAVVGSNVNVRALPKINSMVLEILSYVFLVDMGNTEEKISFDGKFSYPWTKVFTPNGNVGYIYGKYTFHFLGDYTAYFQKEDGKWVMDAFING